MVVFGACFLFLYATLAFLSLTFKLHLKKERTQNTLEDAHAYRFQVSLYHFLSSRKSRL